MSLLLGVDTGGTYTDAVLIRDKKTVLASAKSLTTRQDLSIGIGKAVGAVLAQSDVDPAEVSLASLSTTLATNALVEGQGDRVGLIYIGFKPEDLDKHRLTEALKGDPNVVLQGGHSHSGGEARPFDIDGLRDWLNAGGADVSGYAIASLFATRNAAHELAAAQAVADLTGKPVSLSHQLSAKLNGPKRALTALLNARLIGMIDRLIAQATQELTQRGVQAPLMVVRGDGALISAAQAREKPIETILSGPAASIVGARWMTGADHALVSDIGGTTTDVAVLREGRPTIDPAGAQVGPYRTMVEAVAMYTTGLGGDSEVFFVSAGLKGGVTLGPRRRVPLSLMAIEAPDVVLPTLERQTNATLPGEYDGQFARLQPAASTSGIGTREALVLKRLGTDVQPVGDIIANRVDQPALNRLVDRGIVQLSSVTPSDASHVLGLNTAWNADAARKGMELIGRKRTGAGDMLAPDPKDMAQIIIDQLTYQTGLALLECAFAEDAGFDEDPKALARHVLMQKGLTDHKGLVSLNSGLGVPVVGLGASAKTYYPAVGDVLNCPMELPDHAGVANAIGAVVGRVTFRKRGTITSPSEGQFRVYLGDTPQDFADADTAIAALEKHLTQHAQAEAEQAGAADLTTTSHHDIKRAKSEEQNVFIEAEIIVEVSGRPRIAS